MCESHLTSSYMYLGNILKKEEEAKISRDICK